MRAASRVLALLDGVRRIDESRWVARCPSHQDRSPSLAIRQSDDRVLLHCHAGCTAANIMNALGLTFADLYDNSRPSKWDPIASLRRRAAEGLENWHQAELQRCAEELRARDTLRGTITRLVQADDMTEDDAWDSLQDVCRSYSELEYRYETLLRGSDHVVLEAYRAER
jgi:hypothetical protein